MNYAPQDARIYVLFQRRKVSGYDNVAERQSDGHRYIYDMLPYYQIAFDVEQPGEATRYYEFWSTEDNTIFSGTTRDFPQPLNYPIAGFRFVDGQPNPDTFYQAY